MTYGTNLYLYARLTPIDLTDSSGLLAPGLGPSSDDLKKLLEDVKKTDKDIEMAKKYGACGGYIVSDDGVDLVTYYGQCDQDVVEDLASGINLQIIFPVYAQVCPKTCECDIKNEYSSTFGVPYARSVEFWYDDSPLLPPAPLFGPRRDFSTTPQPNLKGHCNVTLILLAYIVIEVQVGVCVPNM
jgi:hypothetical protein